MNPYLTKHQTDAGPRWALNGNYLPADFTLGLLLQLPAEAIAGFLAAIPTEEPASDPLLAPIDPMQEVWGCGVTYLRSRDAREAESDVGDVYTTVYDAVRPEVFFKSVGWRAVGHDMAARIRRDCGWNVPEPELALAVTSRMEIVGYCVSNDMSSRDIEGENPLYLPQAKTYNKSCAVGPGILITPADTMRQMPIALTIERGGETVFHGETAISQMKRSLEELVEYLGRELDFPQGALLMTGTGIVPDDDFTLAVGDLVTISIGELTLQNTVES